MNDLIKYVYDNGFSQRYYICPQCGSRRLRAEAAGGLAPPYYHCEDCGCVCQSPKWDNLMVQEDEPSLPWVGWDEFNQAHLNSNNERIGKLHHTEFPDEDPEAPQESWITSEACVSAGKLKIWQQN